MLFVGMLFVAVATFWFVLDPVIPLEKNVLGTPTATVDDYAPPEYDGVPYVTTSYDTQLHVVVTMQDAFVYKTGYYEENDLWVPFTFDEQPTQGDWIAHSARASVDAPATGHALVLLCMRNGADVVCGPKAGQTERLWTLVPYP